MYDMCICMFNMCVMYVCCVCMLRMYVSVVMLRLRVVLLMYVAYKG